MVGAAAALVAACGGAEQPTTTPAAPTTPSQPTVERREPLEPALAEIARAAASVASAEPPACAPSARDLDARDLEAPGPLPRWAALAQRRGVDIGFEDGRPVAVLVEVDANARYLVWNDGARIREDATVPERLAEDLAAALDGRCRPLPTASRTRFRAWVAPSALAAFAERIAAALPDAAIRQVRPAQPCYGGVISQGAAALGAPALHRAGARGQGVRVHVLDSGFRGMTSIAANEVGSFGFLGSQTDLESDANAHGTACVEVIRDLAPDAEIAAYRLDHALDVETATRLAVDHGAEVMSVSIAWLGYPWNGAACDAARLAVARGVHWVGSAGNYGDRYWEASAPRVAASGYVEVARGGVTRNPVRVASGPIQLGFGHEVVGPASAALELTLLEDRGSGYRVVATGGSGWDQYISWWPAAGARYAAAIRVARSGSVGRMRLFLYHGTLGYRAAEGSVVNPATLDDVLGIGAVAASQYAWWGEPEVYSARGGGVFRLPLDGCAPSVVDTVSLGAFDGTSAACPGFAGLLAALLSHPSTRQRPLDAIAWTDLWPRGWDPASGRGIARARAPR